MTTRPAPRTTQLAIDGGPPTRTQPFPHWPISGAREEELLLEVLHSGHWGELGGDKVTTFAAQFAAFQDAAYGVCVPNGTMALEMALRALGVRPGDEVITTPYTFIATASAALSLGAKPVFADIDPATGNIDPAKIAAAVTARTKAIVPVHFAGQPADLDGVLAVARQHGLRVLEDAAQAWGRGVAGSARGGSRRRRDIQLSDGQEHHGGRGRHRAHQRRCPERPLLVAAQCRSRAQRRVVPARNPRLELPHDRMGGRGAARATRTVAGANARARCGGAAPSMRRSQTCRGSRPSPPTGA